ncbi:tRNA dihydrouridine synthase DusB [Clostridium sp. CS001]|uniref:tRNA dihydrouridine synthase DusB n=1 Tax=Clostridium sp. CS001 TaxID=2880648 RepID=UPI001CF1735F|nr:tRNA dihydrouridine synthase DusB [Clostridium sp. CS001]MCB2291006.1 tRNA dihydrouridine synthase DusB [Clostridium sp. CS001]
MKISNIELKNDVFLAPMAGVTDIAFREICKELGCGLLYTEMVSAKGLYYGSSNTEALMRISEEERPVAIQIFGSDPKIMANACEVFNKNDDICIVDVNMGCPVNKIVKNGEGSALMQNPKLAAEIIKEMKKVSTKPVTVKFRKGFDSNNVNAVEFAKYMEDAGIDAIAVHGRTREQMYEGKADWDIIRAVKESVTVPVIGNGDVFSVEDAMQIKEITNCDAIMIARGAKGNPWIFREIMQAIRGEEVVYPTAVEKVDMCIKHLDLAVKYHEEIKAVREMRKHTAWYIKSLSNCSEVKDKINTENKYEDVRKLLLTYKEYLKFMNV